MRTVRNTIRTSSDRIINVKNPSAASIHIQDIVLGLSRMPRFSGQTPRFNFTVAAHSLLTSDIVRCLGGTPTEQLQALLHDATEAYYCDLPSPIKKLTRGYKKYESLLLRTIYAKYQIPAAPSRYLKIADDLALDLERFVQWGVSLPPYTGPYLTKLTKACPKRRAWELASGLGIRAQFLNRFTHLYAEHLWNKA